jgi:hypothetical protein
MNEKPIQNLRSSSEDLADILETAPNQRMTILFNYFSPASYPGEFYLIIQTNIYRSVVIELAPLNSERSGTLTQRGKLKSNFFSFCM